jgi:hypothetical protein
MKTTRSDKLEQYLSLLDDLRNEKAHLEGRLEKINAVLTGAAAARGGYRGRQPGARRGRRARNGMSLREAVTQVTRNRPLTKEEILQGIQKLGYRFSTKDPMNSLNAMLYAPANKFRNQNGRFGPK